MVKEKKDNIEVEVDSVVVAVERALRQAMLSGRSQTDVYDDLIEQGHSLSAPEFRRIRKKLYLEIERQLKLDPITEFVQMVQKHDSVYGICYNGIQDILKMLASADEEDIPKLKRLLGGYIADALNALKAKEELVQMSHRDVKMRVAHPEEVSEYISSMLHSDSSLDVKQWDYNVPLRGLSEVDDILSAVEQIDSPFTTVTIEEADSDEDSSQERLSVSVTAPTKALPVKSEVLKDSVGGGSNSDQLVEGINRILG